MLDKLRALVRRYERDTEGRLRLELAATKAALRDALRDQARERAEGAAALRDAVRERDAWRARVPEALGLSMRYPDRLASSVERIEMLQKSREAWMNAAAAAGLRLALVRERRDRWRERVAPFEDRVVALTKELRATQGRLRQAKRRAERLEDCGAPTPCAVQGGCIRHWMQRNVELVCERDRARTELTQAKLDGQWLLQTLGLPATAEMADLRGAVLDLLRERDAARDEAQAAEWTLAQHLLQGGGNDSALAAARHEAAPPWLSAEVPEDRSIRFNLGSPLWGWEVAPAVGPEVAEKLWTTHALLRLLHGCAAPAEVSR